jgi:hypothetical protein
MALGVRITADGGQQVIRTLENVDRAGKRTAADLSASTRTLSSGFGRIGMALQNVATHFTLTGKTGTEQLKQLAQGALGMAAMFGPAGMIVSGIGLTVSAILRMHGNARREMEETAKQHTKTIEELAERADAAATRVEQRRAARDVERLRSRQAVLRAEIGTSLPPTLLGAGGTGGGGAPVDPFARQRVELTSITAQLVEAEGHHRRLTEMQALQASLSGQLAISHQDLERRAERRRELEAAIARLVKEQRDAALDMLSKAAPPELLAHWSNELKKGIPKIEVPVVPKIEADALAPRSLKDRATEAALEIGQAISTGLTNAISSIFSGDFGGGLMRSLGQFFVEVGTALLKFGEIVRIVAEAIRKSLLGLGPGAAIAGGIALIALGNTISGMGGGGGRGGGLGGPRGRSDMTSTFTLGSTSTSSGTASQAMQLAPAQPVVVQIFGNPNDKKVQRWIHDVRTKGFSRGLS